MGKYVKREDVLKKIKDVSIGRRKIWQSGDRVT